MITSNSNPGHFPLLLEIYTPAFTRAREHVLAGVTVHVGSSRSTSCISISCWMRQGGRGGVVGREGERERGVERNIGWNSARSRSATLYNCTSSYLSPQTAVYPLQPSHSLPASKLSSSWDAGTMSVTLCSKKPSTAGVPGGNRKVAEPGYLSRERERERERERAYVLRRQAPGGHEVTARGESVMMWVSHLSKTTQRLPEFSVQNNPRLLARKGSNALLLRGSHVLYSSHCLQRWLIHRNNCQYQGEADTNHK